ncbi:hypothetical protein D3C76_1017540 [compost metagenome]
MAADAGDAARQVQRQVAEFQHLRRRLCRVAAAQHGAQACRELAWITGLGQVVVGAEFQAEDAVQRFAACGEHQHRQVGMFAAQLLEQLQAAAVGQHHVEDDGIRRAAGQRGARLGAVVAGAHAEAFLDQPGTQQFA